MPCQLLSALVRSCEFLYVSNHVQSLFVRSSTAELIAKLFAECDPRDKSPVCSWEGSDIVGLLLLACLFKAVITVFTFGMRVSPETG
jgi:hypothetical protein